MKTAFRKRLVCIVILLLSLPVCACGEGAGGGEYTDRQVDVYRAVDPLENTRDGTIAGGGDKNTWCDCKHAKPTGRVFKRWVIEGYVYYRDVELKCPDCGEISYRSKMF
ncbi:MAG: hypothetical protein IJH38_06195 [Clostridia bacterium]|nr:hypothetical protein [Clostridia bacterium]